ncbi:MAG TPA: hypothetical protein VGX50_19785, partial [Longimicrobium sp.]|nr:hypothetical protein [Longimicrobium sp.]
MRMMWMMAAVLALAACESAEQGEDARAAAPSPPDTASPADTTPDGWKTVVRGTDGFHFVLHRNPEKQVDSVSVTRAGRRVQALVPSQLELAILRNPTYRIDMDFDGHLDFALATLVPASPNMRYDYWRYDPAADRFRYVGEYEMFEPDFTTRTLGTHARLGAAGRSWSNSSWRWEKGKLVEVWRNEQVPEDRNYNRWIYRESELRDGRWVLVKADTMENCEAEPIGEECLARTEAAAAAPRAASGVQAPPRR